MSSKMASSDEMSPLLIDPKINVEDKETIQQPNAISTILGTATEDPSTITSSITSITDITTNPITTCKYPSYDVLVGGRRKYLKTIP